MVLRPVCYSIWLTYDVPEPATACRTCTEVWLQVLFFCAAAPKKKGKKVDVLKSQVTDPGVYDNLAAPPQTAWRIDRMKNMTYTQFWQLVKERRVDKVPDQFQDPDQ